MDVRLSPEQQALQDSAARLVDQLGPRAVGDLGDPERTAKLDAAVTGAGWRELRTATADGAPLASGVELGIVAEALGRGLAEVSFLGPALAGELRRLASAPASGETETVVLTPDLSSVARIAGGGTPSGVAVDVQGSERALLLVEEAGRLELAQVVLRSASSGVDLTRPSSAVGPTVVATPVHGATRPISDEALVRWTALGLSVACADLVGTMEGAVALGTAYAAARHQFGVAIGSFQAVQHLLADAHVLAEGARSVTLHASWAVDELPAADALSAAAVAKAYCARAARQVCETVIQVHGGLGNTWECLAHVYLRRSLLAGDLLGDGEVSLTRVLHHRGIGGGRGLS
ncbi:MAG: acyl-CoA dehydrogenase [Acidimicrobiales bacterium]|jgi:alkylation response protein AidB-like acyl-CoA dehydrogenase